MIELNLEERPIIFPKLTYQIGEKGAEILILGRKRADFKLSEYLYQAAIGTQIPEIAVYDLKNGEWVEYFNNEFWVEPKIGNKYYYKSIDMIADECNLSYFENYVLLHSSAMIKFTN